MTAQGRLSAALLAMLLAGCGLFMRGVPDGWQPADGEPTCWASPLASVADGVAALYAGWVGIVFARLSTNDDQLNAEKRTATIGAVVVSLGFALATVRGALVARDCRRAERELARWRLRRCFRYTRADGERVVACAPTLAACLRARGRALADPERSLVSACEPP